MPEELIDGRQRRIIRVLGAENQLNGRLCRWPWK